jgi:hypothetical protein
MADLQEVHRATAAAYAEAGVEDPDLSYLTQELIDEGEREARALDEVDAEAREASAGPDGAESGNRLWNVWFAGGPGSQAYGYLLSGGTCSGSWYTHYMWHTRSLVGKCPNRSSYIWYVGF